MTDRTQRRYLRFDCDLRAVLERRIGVGTRPGDRQPPPTTAPVTVRCLSASGLGLTFEQGDVAAGKDAIRRVLNGIDWEGAPLDPRFAEYHALHSRDRLDEVFGEILETV